MLPARAHLRSDMAHSGEEHHGDALTSGKGGSQAILKNCLESLNCSVVIALLCEELANLPISPVCKTEYRKSSVFARCGYDSWESL